MKARFKALHFEDMTPSYQGVLMEVNTYPMLIDVRVRVKSEKTTYTRAVDGEAVKIVKGNPQNCDQVECEALTEVFRELERAVLDPEHTTPYRGRLSYHQLKRSDISK